MADQSNWRLSLAIPAIGVLGVLVGGTLQHLFSIDRERSKVFEEREREAYASLLTALEKERLSRVEEEAGRKDSAQKLRMEYDIEAAAAVRRIAVYGNESVVTRLTTWYELSPQLPTCDPHALALVAVAKAMRDTSRPDQSVPMAALSPLVQSCSVGGGCGAPATQSACCRLASPGASVGQPLMPQSDPTAPLLEFALYRVLGNSLPPRHGAGEMLAHLRFTLEHEPELRGCRKHWVLNRIADPRVEAACLELIQSAGHEYLRLPFEMQRYAQCFNDLSDLPPGVDRVDPDHSDIAFDAASFALEWKYRHKNLYAIGLNEARNVALDAGRAIARWTLPWDGACFITSDAWEQIRLLAESDAAALHLIVPLARIKDNAGLLQPGSVSVTLTEPQIGFRNDSLARFDESLRYGNLNKAALLKSLGVPGPWHTWRTASWDVQPTAVSPERGRFVKGGWVARLTSTTNERIEGNERLRWRSRFEGVELLCRQLDARLVAEHNPPGRLLCYDEAALANCRRHPIVSALIARARGALDRPLPSVRNKTGCAASGDAADYLSFAPYSHTDAHGTVRHLDGQRTEAATPGTAASQSNDRAALDQLVIDACTTSLAGTITGDTALLDHTARMVRTWFIDPATRMNPNMRFAQVTAAREQTGKPWGIVDFRGLWPLLDAITLTARAGRLSSAEQLTLKAWLETFLDDVDTRRIGDQPNNIAVWHDLVVAAIAAFVGRHSRAAEVLSDLPLRLTSQLSAFGVPVNELKRTRPLHYGLFLAQGLINAAWLGRSLGIDVWAYAASQHRSIAMLLRFLALNKRLLADYAAAAERFDERILIACGQVPADAIHAEALMELRPPPDMPSRSSDEAMSEGVMPFFSALGLGQASSR